MREFQAQQAFRTPVVRIYEPTGLRLATVAAVLACALAAPVLLQPQVDGARNAPTLRGAFENITGPALAGRACRGRCTAVLRDSAALRRSLSRCADSIAASEARSSALARKLRSSRRRANVLVRANAQLRARLRDEAEPVLDPHPPALPVSGTSRAPKATRYNCMYAALHTHATALAVIAPHACKTPAMRAATHRTPEPPPSAAQRA
jgi:hypothetical protein